MKANPHSNKIKKKGGKGGADTLTDPDPSV